MKKFYWSFLLVCLLIMGSQFLCASPIERKIGRGLQANPNQQMFDAEFSAMRMNETHTGTYVYDFHYPVETDHPMRKLFPGASLFYFQYSNVYEKAIDADKVLTNNCGTRITWWCESDEELCDIFYEAAPGYIWGYCVAEIHPG